MRDQGRPLPGAPNRRSWVEYVSSGILALMLATIVWVMAVNEQDPPRTGDFHGVPIHYENLADGLQMVGNVETEASVTVRAPASRWPLGQEALQATVDLKGLGVGVHNVDVNLRTLDRSAMVIKRSPTRVVVHLEETVSQKLPVETVVADDDTVPPGYSVGAVQASPTSVTVTGPRSLVESVDKVVATAWLRGSKATVESQVTPIPLNDKGEQVQGVQVTPGTIDLVLNVTPLAEFRDVTIRADVQGQPAAGYWVSNITIDPAAVTIQGQPDVIRALPAVVSTEPIDVSGSSDSINKRVALQLPEGVSVYTTDANADTVLVRVDVTAIQGGKTVQPSVEVQGLRSGLEATIAPETVDVILSGPMPELQALQPGDIRVVVNLIGLRVGSHMVSPTVILPEGSKLKVESVSPDPVEVTIAYATGGTP